MKKIIIIALLLTACDSSNSKPKKLIATENVTSMTIMNSISKAGYDTVPSAMYDSEEKLYKLWWCCMSDIPGQGDSICYSKSTDKVNWTPRKIVFRQSNIPGRFDKDSVCDPSVVKVDDMYYLYYGAMNMEEVRTFLKRWCLWKDCESDPLLENEKKAIIFKFTDRLRITEGTAL